MILAALLIAAAEDLSPAGFYRTSQMEVGAALDLGEDGRFHYQLDDGAISEVAEGRWSTDGSTVYLSATRMSGATRARRFDREPLKIEGDQLLLYRYDTVIRLQREELPMPVDGKSWGGN